jgi:chromosome segregation ATPase
MWTYSQSDQLARELAALGERMDALTAARDEVQLSADKWQRDYEALRSKNDSEHQQLQQWNQQERERRQEAEAACRELQVLFMN